jgi:hypothetical protein
MSTISPEAIRSRVAAGILAALPTWRESPTSFHRPSADAVDVGHLAYAVGLGRTVPHSRDRQRLTEGALVETQVFVRFSHRVRADGQVADVDASYTAELALVAAVMSTPTNPGLRIEFAGVSLRSVQPDGTLYIGVADFQVLHRYALQ